MATTGRRPPMAMPAASGDGVLLGDADVEEAVGEAGLERQQPGRAGHGRGDGAPGCRPSAASMSASVNAWV